MTRRPTAPDYVLKARAAGVVILIASYTAFRVPTLASGIEAGVTFAVAMAAVFVFERALTELSDRKHYRAGRVQSIRDAMTDTFATPVRWPDEVETEIAAARHAAMVPIIDRGEVVEPMLFTHEYNPLTPPRGLELPQLTPGIPGWTSELPSEYTGRHRLADAQLSRERTGQFFGEL
jgi:hypothetical protein